MFTMRFSNKAGHMDRLPCCADCKKASICMRHQMEVILQQHWRRIRPDLVVSLIPNFNGVMFQALRRVHPDVPYVTVMTDLADYPPHFWQEKQDQFVICGSGRAVRASPLNR